MDVTDPNERRSITRNAGDTIGPVRLRFDEGEVVAKVQDISITGIGILTRQRLKPGTSFLVEPESSRRLSLELRGEVRHVRKSDHDDYLIGCLFSRLLTMADVTALGSAGHVATWRLN